MSLSPSELQRFAERYLLACDVARQEQPRRGTSGLELEWNLLDQSLRPLETVGLGPVRRSFIDVLMEDHLPPWLADRCQREVFHWMIEWATYPHYSPVATVYEARLLEACQINILAGAGRAYRERLHAWHGNLLFPVQVGHHSIPGGWDLAKQRYLQRCVDLYGAALATAGTHANLSLPEPLLAWDFIHLPPSQRQGRHLDDYKNQVYIGAARFLRAFTALFIATAASTPLRAESDGGEPVVALTEADSVRNLVFPNPVDLDLPGLYRSHADYVRLSYELVRQGLRFGNNNWTPTRARSFVEPVERLIATTSEQLRALYREGLYALGEAASPEEMAAQIEQENLMARIDIPMARVEVRMDDGGTPLELDIANLAFKELLLILHYADPEYMPFAYDAPSLERARRNEAAAARHGLRAEIEHPLDGSPIPMRRFLAQTLEDLRPLAQALDRWELLFPLLEMARGGPNQAERLRERLRREMDDPGRIPLEALRALVEEREAQVMRDVETIVAQLPRLGPDAAKLRHLLVHARSEARRDPQAPVRFRPPVGGRVQISYPDKTSEILDLAQQLVRIPSVTVAPEGQGRPEEVYRAATLIYDDLFSAGLEVQFFENGPYPAVLATFPGATAAPVLLCGHFDVVAPEPDDSHFKPRIEGDYLWGRGAADMKTVVATYMVWMKDRRRRGPPYPGVQLLLIGNEEIGEGEPYGTPHVLEALRRSGAPMPRLLIAGERTGEQGNELWGQVCTANRGLMRFEVLAHGTAGHTGLGAAGADVTAALTDARQALMQRMAPLLTLESPDGWQSQLRFPYLRVGERGIYNISPREGVLGVEVRTIPEDNLQALLGEVRDYCQGAGLTLRVECAEAGVACDPQNPYLGHLLAAIREQSGQEPALGRKLPGTSARFAPGGQGVVWGQSGVGPHAADERHFIPSIEPYYRALEALAQRLLAAP